MSKRSGETFEATGALAGADPHRSSVRCSHPPNEGLVTRFDLGKMEQRHAREPDAGEDDPAIVVPEGAERSEHVGFGFRGHELASERTQGRERPRPRGPDTVGARTLR